MVDFRIKIADTVIEVHAVYESTACFCRDFITDSSPDFSVLLDEDDISSESARSDREREYEGLPELHFSRGYLETLALYRKISSALLDRGVVLFHGSSLMMDGRAYVFTAKSGTGKSTHSAVWRRVFGDRVAMINDDKPLIRITDGGAIAYGTPWNGKHCIGSNISAPIAAICSIHRSPTNVIKSVSPQDALPIVLGQIYRPTEPQKLRTTLILADKLTRAVPFYSLGCNMEDEAALVAYGAMKGDTP
ncbi:MAG: hypothetical protein IJY69_03235 [Clostridia bacterium]|nr:hypothetical protein [Clostridia bacterium]